MPLVQLVFQERLHAPHRGDGAQINDLASEQLVIEQTSEQDPPSDQTQRWF